MTMGARRALPHGRPKPLLVVMHGHGGGRATENDDPGQRTQAPSLSSGWASWPRGYEPDLFLLNRDLLEAELERGRVFP